MRRRLPSMLQVLCSIGALAVASATGCYQKVIRDDRLTGEPVIYEPDQKPDFLDEADEAQRQREKRDANARRDRWRSGG